MNRHGAHAPHPLAVVLGAMVLCVVSVRVEASACPETDVGKVVSDDAGLRVTEPAAGSLQPGDLLLQLNGHRLLTCADLVAALREARQNQLALLLLVRREGQTVVAFFERPTPQVALLAPVPQSPIPTLPPTPLPPADIAAVGGLLNQFMAFGRELQARLPLPMAQPWVRRVGELRTEYERQQAHGSASAVVPVLGYYETVAEILQYRDAATAGRRDLRARSEVVLEYDSGSAVRGWLQRYPFLQPSVLREPEKLRLIVEGESKGQWAPDRAVALLVERALADGTALSAHLATSQSH